ncbi:MAG: hypothetical protein LBL27_03240 [Coriobacteriales bacterium]|jgi:hypothetical protein|nr:hypothetical protein [Coriobacteriales bacterium]
MIDSERLSALLGLGIVPSVLRELGIDAESQTEEVTRFYHSKLYELLSKPETGMWHLSPILLAEFYREELETGSFEVPEEQS